MGILIGVFCAVIYKDWKYYKIPNVYIVFGAAAGLIMTGMSYGAFGFLQVFVQILAVFMLFYPFYLIGGVGAGDVKLFMMTSCFIKGDKLISYIFVTMLMASVMSVIKILKYKECKDRLIYLGGYARKVILTGAVDEYKTDKTGKKSVVRLSIPAFISLILMCFGIY